MADVRVMSWDWKEQIDLDDLAKHIEEMTRRGDGKSWLYGSTCETGSDQFAFVLSTEPIDEHGAFEAYEERWS